MTLPYADELALKIPAQSMLDRTELYAVATPISVWSAMHPFEPWACLLTQNLIFQRARLRPKQ